MEIEDRGAEPSELAIGRAEARELAHGLGQLSSLEQSAVVLWFVEGLDHRSVAIIIIGKFLKRSHESLVAGAA